MGAYPLDQSKGATLGELLRTLKEQGGGALTFPLTLRCFQSIRREPSVDLSEMYKTAARAVVARRQASEA